MKLETEFKTLLSDELLKGNSKEQIKIIESLTLPVEYIIPFFQKSEFKTVQQFLTKLQKQQAIEAAKEIEAAAGPLALKQAKDIAADKIEKAVEKAREEFQSAAGIIAYLETVARRLKVRRTGTRLIEIKAKF